jgi:uncharacterized repeat protein (TIGR03803 family)
MATRATRNSTLLAALLLALSTAPAHADPSISILASFDQSAGWYPQAGLTLAGSTLYGTTSRGGSSNGGAIFSLPVSGGTPTFLASLNAGTGTFPLSGLALSGNTLYGTAEFDGPGRNGTIFSLPLTGGTPFVLASFGSNVSLGTHPVGAVTVLGNKIYGTTFSGGAWGVGTVFSLPLGGGSPNVLASFIGSNGQLLPNALTLSADGSTLYGTTQYGGIKYDGTPTSGCGVVFSVPVSGGPVKVLAAFDGTNGAGPTGQLALSADGNTLYGATAYGGPISNYGTIFSLPITGGSPTVLLAFNGANGDSPASGPILHENKLFGTTRRGGAYNVGEVFSVPISGGTPTIVASFNGTSASYPIGDLTLSGSTLYGTTISGGANGAGTVYAIAIPEPASLLLLSLAAPALLLRRRARKPSTPLISASSSAKIKFPITNCSIIN